MGEGGRWAFSPFFVFLFFVVLLRLSGGGFGWVLLGFGVIFSCSCCGFASNVEVLNGFC